MRFLIEILTLAMLFLIFIALCFDINLHFRNGESLMSVLDQTAELQEATTELTSVIADEKAQVAQAISTLNDKVSDLEAAAPPEVDLSPEIAAVRNAADAVRAIYEPPATDDSAPADDASTPVPVTADPVADDTDTTAQADSGNSAPTDDLETADPTAPDTPESPATPDEPDTGLDG